MIVHHAGFVRTLIVILVGVGIVLYPLSGPVAESTGAPDRPALLVARPFQAAPTATPGVSREPRIVGGTIAAPGAWPFVVALVDPNNPDAATGQSCGGSLIGNRWVVSAAHCFIGDQGQTLMTSVDVVIGRQDLTQAAVGRRVRSTRIINHPNYNPATTDSDIAVIELSETVSGPYLAVAGPTDTGLFATGVVATVAGWGLTSDGGQPSPQLRQVNVPVFDQATCNGPTGYDGRITANMLCAGYPEGGRDSCQGDSGGPLMVPNGNQFSQIGVVSFGDRCGGAGTPGVYTRVPLFRAWVLQQIGGQPGPSPTANPAKQIQSGGVLVRFPTPRRP